MEELHEYLLQARFALENSQSEQWQDVLKNKTLTTGRKSTYRCRESSCVELRKSRASSMDLELQAMLCQRHSPT